VTARAAATAVDGTGSGDAFAAGLPGTKLAAGRRAATRLQTRSVRSTTARRRRGPARRRAGLAGQSRRAVNARLNRLFAADGSASTSLWTTDSSVRAASLQELRTWNGRSASWSRPRRTRSSSPPRAAAPAHPARGKPALVLRTDIANVYGPEIQARGVLLGARAARSSAVTRRGLRRLQPAQIPGQHSSCTHASRTSPRSGPSAIRSGCR
jgi:hypothetical protein